MPRPKPRRGSNAAAHAPAPAAADAAAADTRALSEPRSLPADGADATETETSHTETLDDGSQRTTTTKTMRVVQVITKLPDGSTQVREELVEDPPVVQPLGKQEEEPAQTPLRALAADSALAASSADVAAADDATPSAADGKAAAGPQWSAIVSGEWQPPTSSAPEGEAEPAPRAIPGTLAVPPHDAAAEFPSPTAIAVPRPAAGATYAAYGATPPGGASPTSESHSAAGVEAQMIAAIPLGAGGAPAKGGAHDLPPIMSGMSGTGGAGAAGLQSEADVAAAYPTGADDADAASVLQAAGKRAVVPGGGALGDVAARCLQFTSGDLSSGHETGDGGAREIIHREMPMVHDMTEGDAAAAYPTGTDADAALVLQAVGKPGVVLPTGSRFVGRSADTDDNVYPRGTDADAVQVMHQHMLLHQQQVHPAAALDAKIGALGLTAAAHPAATASVFHMHGAPASTPAPAAVAAEAASMAHYPTGVEPDALRVLHSATRGTPENAAAAALYAAAKLGVLSGGYRNGPGGSGGAAGGGASDMGVIRMATQAGGGALVMDAADAEALARYPKGREADAMGIMHAAGAFGAAERAAAVAGVAAQAAAAAAGVTKTVYVHDSRATTISKWAFAIQTTVLGLLAALSPAASVSTTTTTTAVGGLATSATGAACSAVSSASYQTLWGLVTLNGAVWAVLTYFATRPLVTISGGVSAAPSPVGVPQPAPEPFNAMRVSLRAYKTIMSPRRARAVLLLAAAFQVVSLAYNYLLGPSTLAWVVLVISSALVLHAVLRLGMPTDREPLESEYVVYGTKYSGITEYDLDTTVDAALTTLSTTAQSAFSTTTSSVLTAKQQTAATFQSTVHTAQTSITDTQKLVVSRVVGAKVAVNSWATTIKCQVLATYVAARRTVLALYLAAWPFLKLALYALAVFGVGFGLNWYWTDVLTEETRIRILAPVVSFAASTSSAVHGLSETVTETTTTTTHTYVKDGITHTVLSHPAVAGEAVKTVVKHTGIVATLWALGAGITHHVTRSLYSVYTTVTHNLFGSSFMWFVLALNLVLWLVVMPMFKSTTPELGANVSVQYQAAPATPPPAIPVPAPAPAATSSTRVSVSASFNLVQALAFVGIPLLLLAGFFYPTVLGGSCNMFTSSAINLGLLFIAAKYFSSASGSVAVSAGAGVHRDAASIGVHRDAAPAGAPACELTAKVTQQPPSPTSIPAEALAGSSAHAAHVAPGYGDGTRGWIGRAE